VNGTAPANGCGSSCPATPATSRPEREAPRPVGAVLRGAECLLVMRGPHRVGEQGRCA
jgi:hypothetical protein